MFFKYVFLILLFTLPSFALNGYVDGKQIDKYQYILDSLWVAISIVFIFLMHAGGFSMLEAGFVRAKNATNIIMKNIFTISISAVAFWLIGFGLMFGNGNDFIGLTGFMQIKENVNLFDSLSSYSPPLFLVFIFHLLFASTAATIMSGAVAERIKFTVYIISVFIITALIYPIIGKWMWGGGWLQKLGFLDFAGGVMVHLNSAVIALVAAYLLGPRIGKYDKYGKPKPILGHSMTLAALGTFILWTGWFGFNGGSTLSADVDLIGKIFLNNTLAAAGGSISSLLISWYLFKKSDLTLSMNGTLAGLVSITPGCAYVVPEAALFIGTIAGVIMVLGVIYLDKIKIDDPVGAIPVHGLGGIWGTLMLGVFHSTQGLITGSFKFFFVELLGIIVCILWTGITSFLTFYILNKFIGIRVHEDEEIAGLDMAEHGTDSYPNFSTKLY